MILSRYFSKDGRAQAEVQVKPNLRVVCHIDGREVAVINTFDYVEDAENFAEDFVLAKEKEQHEHTRKLGVLHHIAEPNERNSQPCVA